jgi:hypothetical protein
MSSHPYEGKIEEFSSARTMRKSVDLKVMRTVGSILSERSEERALSTGQMQENRRVLRTDAGKQLSPQDRCKRIGLSTG